MSAKIIAIDYDGTIALDSFPQAGTPNWPVINRAKEEQINGAILILWTCRTGKDLEVALEACANWGLHFMAVNDNPIDRQKHWGDNPRKVYADEYWDDHAVTVNCAKWELIGCDDDLGCSYVCSNCQESFDEDWFYVTGKYRPFGYCPNCGSQMTIEE